MGPLPASISLGLGAKMGLALRRFVAPKCPRFGTLGNRYRSQPFILNGLRAHRMEIHVLQ